jgi:23S rRNA pseudouridine2605 synthase
MSELTRLQKHLAQCGVASRRKAEEYITAGRVTIDGITVVDMGVKIDPEKQIVRVDGKKIHQEKKNVYLLLNKPKGYVTTMSDPQGRPIVTDLIKNTRERLFPVGRLDLDTQGALILTNDGEFAQRVQHPRHMITKTYEALVAGFPSKHSISLLENGITIDGRITAPAILAILKRTSRSTLIKIIIHEGRKRQVRKMFQAVGHPVISLKRIAYGSLFLQNLKEGQYRTLTPKDLNKIFKNIPLQTGK